MVVYKYVKVHTRFNAIAYKDGPTQLETNLEPHKLGNYQLQMLYMYNDTDDNIFYYLC